jgi:hypothetical protein
MQPFEVDDETGTVVWQVSRTGTVHQSGGLQFLAQAAPPASTRRGYLQAYSPDGSSVVTVDPAGAQRSLGLGGFVDSPSDQSTSSASQVASTFLTLPVVPSAKYLMAAGIIAQNTTGNYIPSWTGPAGATMKWNDTTSSLDYSATIGAVNNVFAANAGVRLLFLQGKLLTSSTAGSLTYTFSASAGTSITLADSWLTLTRVG